LCLNGKYIKVKGYDKKVPFLYCIDYYSHDIIVGFLCVSESREAFRKMFRLLKTVRYPLEFLIVDDVIDKALLPLKYYYPKALLQLCSTHILRNIKQLVRDAGRRSKTDYDSFLKDLSKYLRTATSFQNKEKSMYWFLKTYSMDPLLEDILLTIFKKRDYVFAFCKRKKKLPHSNNLIEGLNSHLEGRLKTIRGFNSFKSAERFLNAWMVRRRTKTFNSCSRKFSYLNGKTSLESVLKDNFSIKITLAEIYKKR
jgi:transposase-like protein